MATSDLRTRAAARRTVAAASLLLGLTAPATAYAADQPSPTPAASAPVRTAPKISNGYSMAVSPVRADVIADKHKHTITFLVANNGGVDFDATAHVTDFRQDPNRMIVLTSQPAAASAADQITVSPNRLHLHTGQVQEVRVRVPATFDAEPGDHLLAVAFTSRGATASGKGGNAVNIDRTIGTQLLVTVPGHNSSNAEATAVKTFPPAWFGLPVPFFDRGPVPAQVTVRNSGNVHTDFTGKRDVNVTVSGHRYGGSTRVRIDDFRVQRDSTVNMPFTWEHTPTFCWCTLTVQTRDQAGHVTSASTRVTIVPATYGAAGLLLAGGLAGLGLLYRRRPKKQPTKTAVFGDDVDWDAKFKPPTGDR